MTATKRPVRGTVREDLAFGWHFRTVSGWLSHGAGLALPGKRIMARTRRGRIPKRVRHCMAGMHALYEIDRSYLSYGRLLSFVMVEDVIKWGYDSTKFAGRARTILWQKEVPPGVVPDAAWLQAEGFDMRKARVRGYRLRNRLGALRPVK